MSRVHFNFVQNLKSNVYTANMSVRCHDTHHHDTQHNVYIPTLSLTILGTKSSSFTFFRGGVIPSVVILGVIVLSVVMLNVGVLSVLLLSIIMLNVMSSAILLGVEILSRESFQSGKAHFQSGKAQYS